MQAVVQDEYGDTADVLRPEQVARPEPGHGQVLVRVAAAGVDRGVWHLMAGKPYAARLAFGLARAEEPRARLGVRRTRRGGRRRGDRGATRATRCTASVPGRSPST